MNKEPLAPEIVPQPIERAHDVPIRFLFHRLAIATALMAPGALTFAEPPKETVEEKGKATIDDFIKDITKKPLPDVFDKLDNNVFRAREASQNEIIRRAADHFEKTGQLPSWSKNLFTQQVKDGWGIKHNDEILLYRVPNANLTELYSRLEQVQTGIQYAKDHVWTSGTKMEMPKGKIPLQQALDAMSKQIGWNVRLYGDAKKYADEKVEVGSGLFWNVLTNIRCDGDRRLWPVQEGDGISLRVVKPDTNMLVPHQGFLVIFDRKDGRLSLVTEPKAKLDSWKVTGATLSTTKEYKNLFGANPVTSGTLSTTIPNISPETIGRLGLNLDCVTTGCSKYEIEDAQKKQNVDFLGRKFTFGGMQYETNAPAKTSVDVELNEIWYESYKLGCTAFAEDGKELTMMYRYDSHKSGTVVRFHFDGVPKRLVLHSHQKAEGEAKCTPSMYLSLQLNPEEKR